MFQVRFSVCEALPGRNNIGVKMSPLHRDKELYAVLGVDQTATPAQIRSAFRKLSLAHHPDKGGDERIFEMILRAKEVLCDEQLRAVYDAGGLEAQRQSQ